MDDGLAPRSGLLLRAGLNTEFVNGVGLEMVNDRVTRRASLVVPLPVSLPVTHCVVSGPKTERSKGDALAVDHVFVNILSAIFLAFSVDSM